MNLKKNKHIGSNFDDFLQDEGLLAETDATALKRVLVFQIEKEMEERNLTKISFADQMHTSRSSLDRLLDPENPSVTLLTLGKAASVLGRHLKVEFAWFLGRQWYQAEKYVRALPAAEGRPPFLLVAGNDAHAPRNVCSRTTAE
jgi:antitoxin HicB